MKNYPVDEACEKCHGVYSLEKILPICSYCYEEIKYNKWINVKDEIPEGIVLTINIQEKLSERFPVYAAYTELDGGFFYKVWPFKRFSANDMKKNEELMNQKIIVTHWMYLPNPIVKEDIVEQ